MISPDRDPYLRSTDRCPSATADPTSNSSFDPLIAMLRFAQRYTARIDFTDRVTAEADLERTNAFRDANDAEAAGVRLVLP
jgi:hypothetical protein